MCGNGCSDGEQHGIGRGDAEGDGGGGHQLWEPEGEPRGGGVAEVGAGGVRSGERERQGEHGGGGRARAQEAAEEGD